MHSVALKLLGKKEKEDDSSVKIGFHRVLSTSVDHLHMHGFELPFKSNWIKYTKYHPGYFLDIDKVYNRLKPI